MTDYEQELTKSFDWAGLRRDCVENAVETLHEYTLDELELFELTDGESVKGSVYLGSVFNLTPSGKYYMPFACSNVEPCPDCGGDGHAETDKTPGDKIVVDCPYCNATGKRYISELAEGRGQPYQECLDGFLARDIGVGWDDTPNSHYILCPSCKNTPRVYGSGRRFVTCPSCDGMGSAEAYQDELWQEALNKVCEENDMWNESGEGDPCDVFVARWVSFDEIVRYLLECHLDVVTAWLKSEETIKTVKSGLRAVKSAMNKIEQLESEVR